MSDLFRDGEGYPTEAALARIRQWPYTDIYGMLTFVRSLWEYADAGYWTEERPDRVLASTAGWSGNESLIEAMKDNLGFWLLCWESSRRGGHYEFRRVPLPVTQLDTTSGEPK